MGIFDKIDVSKIPIDEATILDRVAIIIKFSRWQRNLQKKCVARSEFLFCLFCRFRHDCGCAELASNFTTLSNP